MVNFQMQESMNGLSLVTVILLPASVMTGYFGACALFLPRRFELIISDTGMNFDRKKFQAGEP
jgi:hypothetical protein